MRLDWLTVAVTLVTLVEARIFNEAFENRLTD
jgi:hypothetical protein